MEASPISRSVVFDAFGGPEVLRIVDGPIPAPAAGEVRIRMEAFVVNPLDAMLRAGVMPMPVPLPGARLGVEGTGVVDALGSEVDGLTVGDPVLIVAIPDAPVRGAYAEHTVLPASRVLKRPAGLSVEEAAAIWVGVSTAYGALIEQAGMRAGDRVLITAASGAVGRAALQVANQLGAVPIAVTRHASKREELLAAGAAAVIATDTDDIGSHAGADIALDLVRGPGQQALVDAIRPGGSLVVAGFLDPRPTPFPDAASKTIHTYRGFDHILDPVVVARMAAFLDAGVRLGNLRPRLDEVFAFDDVAKAHRRLEDGQHEGKIVVVV